MESDDRNGESVFLPDEELTSVEVPLGVDRRTFRMRTAVIGAATVMTGRTLSAQQQIAAASAAPPQVASKLSTDLDVVKKSKGPIITTLDEFYKVGPGPSSSHMIGPMRILTAKEMNAKYKETSEGGLAVSVTLC